MLSAPFRPISPLTQRAYIFLWGGETLNHCCFLDSCDPAGATRTSTASLGGFQESCGVAEVTALLPGTRLNVQPLL